MENTIDSLVQEILDSINNEREKMSKRAEDTDGLLDVFYELVDMHGSNRFYQERIRTLKMNLSHIIGSLETARIIERDIRNVIKKYDFTTITKTENSDILHTWNISEVRNLLEKWSYSKTQRQRVSDKINELLLMKQEPEGFLTSSKLDDMPKAKVTGDPVYKSVEKLICGINKEIGEWREQLVDIETSDRLVEYMLNHISVEEKQVLEYRYLHRLSWLDIQQKVGYDERHCRRLEKSAIEKMCENLNN